MYLSISTLFRSPLHNFCFKRPLPNSVNSPGAMLRAICCNASCTFLDRAILAARALMVLGAYRAFLQALTALSPPNSAWATTISCGVVFVGLPILHLCMNQLVFRLGAASNHRQTFRSQFGHETLRLRR